jgi:chorismate mutase
MNIPEHRKAIDRLDLQIVSFKRRTKHVLAIGEIKQNAGEEIYAPHREQAVLNQRGSTKARLQRVTPGHLQEIMSSALSTEKSMKIVSGPEATFTRQLRSGGLAQA